ncbi:MAG: DEAD/DEAH box helicase [Nanoarchaeota archaeon]|nr:DEAD/DEAH box helicase [Nanoarchaeota archaeon]
MKFSEINISPNLVRALNEMDITEATDIQEKAIPTIKEGKDLIGISRTGSGKTLAFGVPILENVVKKGGVQVLILAPTRELASQISREMGKFGKYVNFSIATVFGGVAIGPQMDKISKSEIVVGTPGRILDHLGRGTLNLDGLKTFVLDEADKMVDMGFIDDINRVLECTNNDRQILLFGATISNEVKYIKQRHMNDPVTIKAKSQVKEDLLEQFYYDVQQNEKFSYLMHLLNKENTNRVIIFCSTKATVNVLTKNLRRNGIDADMIHGDLTQNRRMKVIEDFNNDKQEVLVASAVAARGLDIKNVSHVFNYDLPRNPEEYIHRIGRTARAGESGKAISLLSRRDHDSFGEIKRRYRIKIERLDVEKFDKVQFDAGQRFDGRRSGGGRSSGRSSGFGSRGRSNSRGFGSRGFGNRDEGRSNYGNRDEGRSNSGEGFRNRPKGRFSNSNDRSSGRSNFGNRDNNRSNGFGDKSRNDGGRNSGFGNRSRNDGGRNSGFGNRSRNDGGRSNGFGNSQRNDGGGNSGFGNRSRNDGGRNSGFENRSRNDGGRNSGFENRSRNDGGRSNSGEGFRNRPKGRSHFGSKPRSEGGRSRSPRR